MAKKYVVVLSEAERARLRTLVGGGTAPARTLTHARILLKTKQGEGGPGWRSGSRRWRGCGRRTPPAGWPPP